MRRGSWRGLPRRRAARWPSALASAVAHLALVLLALDLSRRETDAMWRRIDAERESRERIVTPVYVPLPPLPAPPPPPPPPEPEPEPEQPPEPEPEPEQQPPPVPQPALPAPPPNPNPEPEPNAPADAARSEGEERDEELGERRSDRADAGTPERAEISTAPTIESEARRIFGRRRPRTPPGAGPRATRPMESYAPERPDRCIPQEGTEADSARTPLMGVVTGRIFRGDTGRPLAGAHLQMLGAPFTAFTDENGVYQFRFDLSMVDNCRTQYVRVSAPGYQSRLLVLAVGRNVRSEDVMLRRR